MYRNYWIEEIRIKEAINLFTTLLNDEFKGSNPNPQEWLDLIEDLVDTLYSSDILILDALVRYEIICNLDDYGLVDKLELLEKEK